MNEDTYDTSIVGREGWLNVCLMCVNDDEFIKIRKCFSQQNIFMLLPIMVNQL